MSGAPPANHDEEEDGAPPPPPPPDEEEEEDAPPPPPPDEEEEEKFPVADAAISLFAPDDINLQNTIGLLGKVCNAFSDHT